jgi:CHAT domain-containing protein/Tfp pilus assembly protein PilF
MTIPAPAFAFKDINATTRLSNKHHFFYKSERKILLISSEKRNRFDEAVEYNNTEFDYAEARKPEQASEYLKKPLVIFQEVQDKHNEDRVLGHTDTVYSDIGQAQQTLDYYQQLELRERTLKELESRREVLKKLALTHRGVKDYEHALEILQEILILDRQLEDKQGEGVTLYMLGMTYKDLGKYKEAITAYEQSLKINQQLDDRDGQSSVLNGLADLYQHQGNQTKAEDYQRQASAIFNPPKKIETASQPDSPEAQKLFDEASKYNESAFNYAETGKPDQALDYFKKALVIFQEIKDKRSEGRVLGNIGTVYEDMGQTQQALEYHQKALDIAQELKENYDIVTTLSNIAVLYGDLGYSAKSLEYLERAYKEANEPKMVVIILNNFGQVYGNLGQFEKALEYQQKALASYQDFRNVINEKDRGIEAATLSNIGMSYLQMGQFQKAIEYIEQAFSIDKAREDLNGEATSLNNLGLIYGNLGQPEKAMEYFQKALLISQKTKYQSSEATTLNNIATQYHYMNQFPKALENFQKSLSINQKIGNREGEAQNFANIGSVYGSMKQSQKALENLQKALLIFQNLQNPQLEAVTLSNIGGQYLSIKDFEKSLEYLQQALPMHRKVQNRSSEATTLYNLAYLEVNRGNLQAALAPIQSSIEIVEELRTKIISPELRQSYFATVQSYYQFYIDLLMKLHQQNPSQGYDQQAFNISERSHARTLLELLTEAKANIKEGINPQLLAKETELQNQLDTVEQQRLEIYNKPNSTDEQKSAINQRQKTLITQYQDLQNEIRAKSPKYAALKYPQPLTLAQVQQQILDPDTALLQYSVGKDKSYLWIITKDGFTSHSLPAQKEIETAARELLNAIQYGGNDTANISKVANQLSQLVLTPAAKLKQKRLIIVPDGVLSYVPFSTLTLNDKPLINQHELVNLPSSSSLAIIRQETQNRKPAPKTLAILADPIFSADDPRLKAPQKQPISPTNPDLNQLDLNRVTKTLKKSRAEGDNNQFPRLPRTRQEAQAILALLPKTETIVAFDDQANLNLAINPQLSQYRLIHLATHGVFNGEDPAYSGIILSLVDAKGTPINGFLRLNEIFNLNLPAELVVLSACETGLGKEIKGEGLVGLTRGFMYAGTPRVLVSLWKVDDQATAELMTRFYKLILEKKLPPAQALREAQLQMQTETEWKSPYYWSAFILQGEWR